MKKQSTESNEIKLHPISTLFPEMSASEFEALKIDIAKHGLREPILIFENQIIDGRNRYKACLELGVKPVFKEWDQSGSLVDLAISSNLQRRHLNSSQKAVLALELLPHIEKEARERQKIGRGKRIDEEGDKGQAREKVAQLMGTNARYIDYAKKLKESHPSELKSVLNGEKSLIQALREKGIYSKSDGKYEEKIFKKGIDYFLRKPRTPDEFHQKCKLMKSWAHKLSGLFKSLQPQTQKQKEAWKEVKLEMIKAHQQFNLLLKNDS